MAKPERRGGLGRGLGSLLPGTYDSPAPAAPAPERQRVTIEVEEEAAREAPVSTRPAAIAIEEELSGVVLSEPIPREVVSLTEVSDAVDDSDRSTDEVPIEKIAPNPDQPRTQFKKEEIEELSNSIEKDGLLQPILVRRMDDGTYQIIAGERRWQASKAAGLEKVPVRIKDVDDNPGPAIPLRRLTVIVD